MNGGEISNNSARVGGGVSVWQGTFIMNGGKIIGNNANYAGGVSSVMGLFIMEGGKISGNSAVSGGGGVGAEFSLFFGGNAVINDNTSNGIQNNVELFNDHYIFFSADFFTENPPTAGMSVGVTKKGNHGVFVQSGATDEHLQFFFADEVGSVIIHRNGALQIINPSVLFDSIAKLDKQIVALRGDTLRLYEQVLALQNDTAQLHQLLTTCNNQSTELHDSIGGLHITHASQITSLHDSIRSLHQHHANCSNQNITLSDSVSRLNTRITTLLNNIFALQKDSADLQDSIRTLWYLLDNYDCGVCEICEGNGSNIMMSTQTVPLQVFPNPVINELHITNHDGGIIELFGMNGKRVYSARANGNTTIDMSAFQSGNYILRIGNRVAKIVKQ
jgi:hypothetical protein